MRKNVKERKGEGESQSVSAGSNKRVNESNERSKGIIDFIAGLSYDYLFSKSQTTWSNEHRSFYVP